MSTESSFIEYDEHGDTIRWGQANATAMLDVGGESSVIRVEVWSVLRVTIWLRNNERNTEIAVVCAWQESANFMVERWEHIYPHYLKYYASAGIANRWKWEVERWIWTRENGWQAQDNLKRLGGYFGLSGAVGKFRLT